MVCSAATRVHRVGGTETVSACWPGMTAPGTPRPRWTALGGILVRQLNLAVLFLGVVAYFYTRPRAAVDLPTRLSRRHRIPADLKFLQDLERV